MKIAVYHHLPSGGAKRMIYEFIRRLSNKHDFHVFTYSDANHEFCDIRPFVKEYHIKSFQNGRLLPSPLGRLNQFTRWRDLERIRDADKKMAAEIDAQNFDIVWINPSHFQNAPSIISSLKSKCKLFYCQEPLRVLYEQMPTRPYDRNDLSFRHFLDKIDPFYHLFFSKLREHDYENFQQADHIIVNSEYMNTIVSEIYRVQPTTNYGGVDIDFFKPLKIEKRNYLFSVGSLTPLKGFDFLIRALGTIPENERLPLVIASNFSNPPEKAFLQELARERRVDLQLESGITDASLREHYNEAKLTLCAPYREPFGLVPVESMACGTAVVAVAEGGLVESIENNKNGLLTDRNETDFGEAIRSLLADETRLALYGTNGRQIVEEKWSWQHSATNFDLYLQKIAEKN